MYFAIKISIGFVIIYKLYIKFAVDEVSGKVSLWTICTLWFCYSATAKCLPDDHRMFSKQLKRKDSLQKDIKCDTLLTFMMSAKERETDILRVL